jgi:hypothetical protein
MWISGASMFAAIDMKPFVGEPLANALSASGPNYAQILAFEGEFATEWLHSHLASDGRDGAATALVRYVSEYPANTSQIGIVRNIGNKIEPEFTTAVLTNMRETTPPLVTGRLLHLLRNATPTYVTAIAKFLSDIRPAEELSKLATADGATPFRVCDVAYNVLQEVRAADKSTTKLLVRSSSIEERDELVAPVREQTAQPDENPKPPAPLPPTASTPVPMVTPLPPASVAMVAEAPAVVAESQTPLWPWLFGIATLAVIVLLVLKRRA